MKKIYPLKLDLDDHSLAVSDYLQNSLLSSEMIFTSYRENWFLIEEIILVV